MRKSPLLSLISALFLLSSLSACGGGPSDSAFLGIYEITSWTETTDSCDNEATSVLEEKTSSETLVLIDACSFSFPGVGSDSWINVTQCSDVSDCDEERCEGNTINISFGHFGMLANGSDSEGWTNEISWGATSLNGEPAACAMTASTPILYQDEAGVLTFEKRTYRSTYEPINGECLESSFKDGEWVENFDEGKLEKIAKDTVKNGDCVTLMVVTFGALSPTE